MKYDESGELKPKEIPEERAKQYLKQIEESEWPDLPYDPPAKGITNSQTQGTGPSPSASQVSKQVENAPIKAGGDPLILFSGQFHHEVIDLEVNGRGLHFCFKLTYLNQTTYKGSLGYNWDHSYNLWLREEQIQLVDGTFQNIVYRSTGELRQDPYIQITGTFVGELPPLDQFPDAIFQSPAGFFDRLEKTGQKYILQTVTGLRLEYNDEAFHKQDRRY